MQQGAYMNKEKENSTNKADHSDLSSNGKPQQAQQSDQKQSEHRSDPTQKKSGVSEPRTYKESQSGDKGQKDHKNFSNKSDII